MSPDGSPSQIVGPAQAGARGDDPNSWERRLVTARDLPVRVAAPDLSLTLASFHDFQVACWPVLQAAVRAFDGVVQRHETVDGQDVVIQWNPGRRASTTARVDPASVSLRRCFLCARHLPPEEHALAFGPHLVVLCNPAPLVSRHLVVSHREHVPQALSACLVELVSLAWAAGRDWLVLYNGPKAGASAPDHLHLQLLSAGQLPVEATVRALLDQGAPPALRLLFSGRELSAWRLVLGGDDATGSTGRATWVFAGPLDRVREGLEAALGALGDGAGGQEEPPLNVICFVHAGMCVAVVFPRAAHRPTFFFADEPDKLLVSPGAVDVAGLLITVREEDFGRLDASVVREIYRQTCLGPAALAHFDAKLVMRLEGAARPHSSRKP